MSSHVSRSPPACKDSKLLHTSPENAFTTMPSLETTNCWYQFFQKWPQNLLQACSSLRNMLIHIYLIFNPKCLHISNSPMLEVYCCVIGRTLSWSRCSRPRMMIIKQGKAFWHLDNESQCQDWRVTQMKRQHMVLGTGLGRRVGGMGGREGRKRGWGGGGVGWN